MTARRLWTAAFLLLLAGPPAQAASVRPAPPDRDRSSTRSLLGESYGRLALSQDQGSYAEALRSLRADPSTESRLKADLGSELEALRGLEPAERQARLQDIFSYYSQTQGGHFKTNATNLLASAGYSMDQLARGEFDSALLAERLLAGIDGYQRDVLVPILRQVETQLQREFPDRELLFLGRDFAPGFLWMVGRGVANADRVHLANVTRTVSAEALAGKLDQLGLLLRQTGVDPQRALEKGLVILDSGVQGRIPAVVLRALCQPLSPAARYQLLSRTEVRYLRSARVAGPSVAVLAGQGGRKEISDADLTAMLTQLQGIPELAVELPPSVARYRDRKHNLLEHRPKSTAKITGLGVVDGVVRTLSEEPQSPSLRINSLLGLHADLAIAAGESVKLAPAAARAPAAKPEESRKSEAEAFRPSGELVATFGEIDRLGADREAMRRWQDAVPPAAGTALAQMRVVRAADGINELWMGQQRAYRLVETLGEGRNVVVYRTDRGTAVKVVKDARDSRKQLLLAWADGVLASYGVDHARVLAVEPHGLFLEQELVAGPTLEARYGGAPALPQELAQQIVEQWGRARQLANERGIWLDFKSANFGLRSDGHAVNVDYVPRLNKSFFRYFRDDQGRDYDSTTFLDEFLHHDLRKSAKRTQLEPQPQRPGAAQAHRPPKA